MSGVSTSVTGFYNCKISSLQTDGIISL